MKNAYNDSVHKLSPEKANKHNPTTRYIFPPIPSRCCDWIAFYDEEGVYGYGETEQEAIQNLLDLF